MKALILIVAYNAETTLSGVLDRIPRQVLAEHDCEVLVIDDASSDRTFAVGLEYRQSRPDLPLTVLCNPSNQGYGGNQKLGYSYALAHGFDVVALVHGDGQYAPEELPRLLQPIADGSADAVFGSRMMAGATALRGGMPLYKFVGNKVLTTTQNLLSGARLSEWHSGYRLYSTALLRQIRFESNSDGFSFDTEIILQVLNAKRRLVELPIPTFYGDEICRVNGIKYAGEVLGASLRNVLHRTGLKKKRSFTPRPHGIVAGAASQGLTVSLPLDIAYLESLPDPAAFLEGLRYVLGGSPCELIITTTGTASALARQMGALGRREHGYGAQMSRTSVLTPGRLRALMREAGFDVLDMTPGVLAKQVSLRVKHRPHADHLLAETTITTARLVA